MREYTGAVLFVDILGISALTTSEKPLIEPRDFLALGAKTGSDGSNQLFCANLLSKFRKTLRQRRRDGLHISQLSDCAFLWSKKPSLVVEAARDLFQQNASTGILARAGMTYGQIIEPEKTNTSLGQFICGEAVTRAAKLEGAGKGSRVFIDREIGGLHIQSMSPKAFEGLPNPSDYRVVDEFLWFSCPKDLESRADKAARLKGIATQIIRFRHAPAFRWNASSAAGRIHIGATIERLSVAAKALALEMNVEPPHFALQTSGVFQELYEDAQYSSEREQKLHARVERWHEEYKP